MTQQTHTDKGSDGFQTQTDETQTAFRNSEGPQRSKTRFSSYEKNNIYEPLVDDGDSECLDFAAAPLCVGS